ncbi:MAG: winged helix-turn-helix transcriptional regulator [Lutibacter sp.]|uniref:helix-turn-helix domain-containing protein n=1 Tax=Lutibacter sp. TaxID=1925666 RepID=UPI001A00341B|nr:helix-turn-helix domain-containing protein [Lutibacter sp.]NOR27558.1 winged helix-turn-helix transcriptional regulator [Lutibacter sp.]
MEEERQIERITGVYLPGQVIFNKNLTIIDSIIFWLIDSLDSAKTNCYASNGYIAKRLNISESKVSRGISRLVELGYIEQVSFDGRKRVIKVIHSYMEKYKNLVDEYNCLTQSSYSASHDQPRQPNTISPVEVNKINEINDVNNSSKEEYTSLDSKDDNLSLNEKKQYIKKHKRSLIRNYSSEDNKRSKFKESLKSNTKTLTKKIKVNLSKDNTTIVSHWNNLGLRQHNLNNPTKTLDRINNTLDKLNKGTMFSETKIENNNKFTKQEIIEAITNFSLMALSPDYQPVSGGFKDRLKKLSLDQFIYNAFGSDNMKSLFLDCLKTPQLLKQSSRTFSDDNPELTKAIKHIYNEKILGSIKSIEWDSSDENKFIKASKGLWQFFEDNKSKVDHYIVGSYGTREIGMATILLESVIHSVGEDQFEIITPGFLRTSLTFSHRLPSYCFREGIINE